MFVGIKIFLICGDVNLWVVSFILWEKILYKCLYIRLWGCKFVCKGYLKVINNGLLWIIMILEYKIFR